MFVFPSHRLEVGASKKMTLELFLSMAPNTNCSLHRLKHHLATEIDSYIILNENVGPFSVLGSLLTFLHASWVEEKTRRAKSISIRERVTGEDTPRGEVR